MEDHIRKDLVCGVEARAMVWRQTFRSSAQSRIWYPVQLPPEPYPVWMPMRPSQGTSAKELPEVNIFWLTFCEESKPGSEMDRSSCSVTRPTATGTVTVVDENAVAAVPGNVAQKLASERKG